MRTFLELVRGGFQTSIAYRGSFFLRIIGNIIYLVMAWFLWHSVYGANKTMHGLDFTTTYLQIACAGVLVVIFNHYCEWFLSHEIREGVIIMRLVRPYDYQLSNAARCFGRAIFMLITVTAPTMLVLFLLFPQIAIDSLARALLFACSIACAFTINFCLDYMVGTIAFYTESVWGFSTAKSAIVSFFSGAMIPIAFFPHALQVIANWLPFQAIYSVPLSILLRKSLDMRGCLMGFGQQIFWVIVLIAISRLFFNRALKSVTVNGG